LRKLQRNNGTPVAGKDVKLLPGAEFALRAARSGLYDGVKFAVASRTKSIDWAHHLLTEFGIRELMSHIEIFPGDKRAHFEKIAAATGIAYQDMLFFDDARDGKYGNCVPVSEMGVLAVHCPAGLDTEQVFTTGLERFSEWDGAAGTIVEWNGSVTKLSADASQVQGQRQEGTVKSVIAEKKYGFINYGDSKTSDLFFHFNDLPDGMMVDEGQKVSFVVKSNPKTGKNMASNLAMIESSSSTSKVTMEAFSMNLPFAALLANEYKTLETRNGTMFVRYPEGTQMLLHVGQRIYPDGNKHIDVMKSGGLSDDEIDRLKSLPKGFGKGMAVAIVEIGRTYETSVKERSDPEFQRNVAAFGSDSGKIVTEIKRVQYLKRPMNVSAQGGVFKVQIDPNVIPDGWVIPSTTDNNKVGTVKSGKPMYSISG
jgi:magnesium-dependent phosphatase 1